MKIIMLPEVQRPQTETHTSLRNMNGPILHLHLLLFHCTRRTCCPANHKITLCLVHPAQRQFVLVQYINRNIFYNVSLHLCTFLRSLEVLTSLYLASESNVFVTVNNQLKGKTQKTSTALSSDTL